MNNPVIRFGLLWLTLLYLPCLYANEVRNGDFSDATRFWFVLVNGGFRNTETVEPFVQTDHSGLHMRVGDIPGEKEQPAAVTLNQRLQELRDGSEYVLRFEVKGISGESMLVGVGKPVATGPNRGNLSGGIPVRELVLEDEWQFVEIVFVYNEDRTLSFPDDAKETLLQFRVGLLTDLYLREISVTEN